ncbi:type IV pilin protein [Janthinobacterium sp. CG_S6]|uniref:type IV pilin protein n=1 Tax=unclassified Janthinobacterium TaxID=2610881 RepID=UPI00034728BA|nr:type IV pilus assembly protein PilE [Janthinobacterium sp. CG_S6]
MRRPPRPFRAAGVSLLELLAVLVIVSVLAALTYPTFQHHVVKAKRAEAQAALMQLMQQQERYYSQNNSYLTFSSASTDPDEKLFKWWSGQGAAVASGYEIRATACVDDTIAQCVKLDAVPGTDKVDARFADAACQTLTLTSTGDKSASGPSPRCWP